MKLVKTNNGQNYLLPFLLVTTLFFLWGFAHSILDVLNKDFQIVFEMTKTRSALIQLMVYGGYFLMALPAGWIIKRYGYRRGVVFGLLLYAAGAFLFIPGSKWQSFPFFLFSLFVIGCGLTCLETAANPYVTVLGEPRYGSARLNFAQSFNGLGWIVGPLVGSLVILQDASNVENLAKPYMGLGIAVVIVAILFMMVKLPEVEEGQPSESAKQKQAKGAYHNPSKVIAQAQPHEASSLWKYPHFVFGLVALFFYVAAQTGINSFFINYVTETDMNFTPTEAGLLLSFGGMGLFMVGRLAGSWLLSRIAAARLMWLFSCGAIVCMVLVVMNTGWLSIGALFVTYLFESIMFPTIFSMSIQGLGHLTKQASSLLIMSIVGGALAPLLMGYIGEESIAVGFIVPLLCFVMIAAFSKRYEKLKIENYRAS